MFMSEKEKNMGEDAQKKVEEKSHISTEAAAITMAKEAAQSFVQKTQEAAPEPAVN